MEGDAERFCHDDFDDARPRELDVLGLRVEVRNALVRGGCNMIADIEFLIDEHSLERVRHIGQVRADVIIERVSRWAAQKDFAAPE